MTGGNKVTKCRFD